jgi:hypothetical protein
MYNRWNRTEVTAPLIKTAEEYQLTNKKRGSGGRREVAHSFKNSATLG